MWKKLWKISASLLYFQRFVLCFEAARFGYFYMKHLLTCFALFAGQSQKVEKKGVLSVDIWEDLLTKVS